MDLSSSFIIAVYIVWHIALKFLYLFAMLKCITENNVLDKYIILFKMK